MTLSPEELDRKIKEAQAKQSQETAARPVFGSTSTGASRAARAATDLAAGVIVGGALGYGLDKWLHTMPLFMILLLFAGFAAGVLNIYRAEMGQDNKVGFRPDKNEGPGDTGNKRE
jgi:ATP synthase protein I